MKVTTKLTHFAFAAIVLLWSTRVFAFPPLPGPVLHTPVPVPPDTRSYIYLCVQDLTHPAKKPDNTPAPPCGSPLRVSVGDNLTITVHATPPPVPTSLNITVNGVAQAFAVDSRTGSIGTFTASAPGLWRFWVPTTTTSTYRGSTLILLVGQTTQYP